MTLIVKPHTIPMDARDEFSTMFQVENNMGCWLWFEGRGFSDVQEWINEQGFTVIMYRGWWHTFFFDHPNSFLITQMMFPKYSWHCTFTKDSTPEEFKPFYDNWRAIYQARQAAHIARVAQQREQD